MIQVVQFHLFHSHSIALVLLMLTATLSGCLGGEDSSEEVDTTSYTDQIDAHEATINQLLGQVSALESNYASSQNRVDSLQHDVVNLVGVNGIISFFGRVLASETTRECSSQH